MAESLKVIVLALLVLAAHITSYTHYRNRAGVCKDLPNDVLILLSLSFSYQWPL